MAVRGAPGLGGPGLYAEYPFLPGAEALAEDLAASLRVLLEDPALERARELGRARIRGAIEDPRGAVGMEELSHASEGERFLSFQFARVLLGAAASSAPQRRWAVAEAKRAWGRLKEAPTEELLVVAQKLGFELAVEGEVVTIPLVDYVRLATPIREAEFRLGSQDVRGGKVFVRPARAARLLQEGIRRRLSVPLELTSELRERLRREEAEFLREVDERIPAPQSRPQLKLGPLVASAFPPCIRKMRRSLQAGENLSHAGRFALAAFLHRIGADAETIVDAYRGAPDFDEGVTRYQVEHITRHDDGAGYDPPACATLRTHGLCLRDGDPTAPDAPDRARDERCFDPGLTRPLQYYRMRSGRGPTEAPAARRGRSPGPDRTP
jgi:DNA primase large subunit